jgi:hypothetical protein
MEETDMCHSIGSTVASHHQSENPCPAKCLLPEQRQQLAVQALAGTQSITQLAEDLDVSRKFVYQQVNKAEEALDAAFTAPPHDGQVLFYLPVTKAWIRQFILALVLICHCSYRGVVELFRDLFDYRLSVGTVHNVVHAAVGQARQHNLQQDLSAVRHGAHDELFQSGQPVLVGADVHSTYCYLLSLEEHRDAETWGVRLLELADRGFDPDAIVADFGGGLRAGQELALPTTPCRGDVFHALQSLEELVGQLDNRAYQALDCHGKLQRQQDQNHWRHGRSSPAVAQKIRHARLAEAAALALADDVAVLVRWLREDILPVAGPTYEERCALYDFVVAELGARREHGPQQLAKAYTFLGNHRDDILAFAKQLDSALATLAAEFQVPVTLVRELLHVQALELRDRRRWQRDACLHRQLGGRYYALSEAVEDLARHTVRASSIIENLNSRRRPYFFLRRHLGPDYLVLLQFFLNHRRFLRSEHPERVDKSPAELLTTQPHPHWLELLGFTRFSRN